MQFAAAAEDGKNSNNRVSSIPHITENPKRTEAASASAASSSRPRLWARRVLMIIFVLVVLQVGMILLIAPWTSIWTNNEFLLQHLSVRGFALHGFVRGAISGLGLVNLWMGIWEGVHYREK